MAWTSFWNRGGGMGGGKGAAAGYGGCPPGAGEGRRGGYLIGRTGYELDSLFSTASAHKAMLASNALQPVNPDICWPETCAFDPASPDIIYLAESALDYKRWPPGFHYPRDLSWWSPRGCVYPENYEKSISSGAFQWSGSGPAPYPGKIQSPTAVQESIATEQVRQQAALQALGPLGPTLVLSSLLSVTPTSGMPGDKIVIKGSGFDPDPKKNVIIFSYSGTYMAVAPVSSTDSKLDTVIPNLKDKGTQFLGPTTISVLVNNIQSQNKLVLIVTPQKTEAQKADDAAKQAQDAAVAQALASQNLQQQQAAVDATPTLSGNLIKFAAITAIVFGGLRLVIR